MNYEFSNNSANHTSYMLISRLLVTPKTLKLNSATLARLTAIQEVPGSIPGYTLEIFLEV